MELMDASISSFTNAPAQKAQAPIDERPNNKLEEQLEYLKTLELIFVEALRRANTLLSTLSCHIHQQLRLALTVILILRGKITSEVSFRGLNNRGNQRDTVPLETKY